MRKNNEVSFEDWYLPSKDELWYMHENLWKNDIGDFVKDEYWSST